MITTIICPHCKKQVEITEAFTHQIQQEVESDLKKEHEKQLLEIKEKTFESAKKEFEEKYSLESTDLKKQVEEQKQKINEFREQELKIREEKRLLEEREKELKLEVERKIDEEKKKIEETVLKQEAEKYRMKELDKEKIINDLKKDLEAAQRRANQGSQQRQGEVMELDLEQSLRSSFPTDIIEPVEKGVKGADIRQIVKTSLGNLCGVILWESKRTKAWDDKWTQTLKDNLRAESANVPIIVSTVMPKDIDSGFGLKDGVWVCGLSLVLPLAEILRQKLIEVAKEKYLSQGKGEKADKLYSYITSHEFSQQVDALLEIYKDMDEQVSKERVAFEKIWKIREEQVKKLKLSTARVVGGIMGQIGSSSMPQIKGLDLLEIESGEK